MASVTSNVLSPQQAALNNKLYANPFQLSSAMTQIQKPQTLNTQPVNFTPTPAQTTNVQQQTAPLQSAPVSPTVSATPPSTPTPVNNALGTQNPNAGYGNGAFAPNTAPPTYPGLVGNLANAAQGNTQLGQAGNAITQKYEGLINSILRGTIGQEVGDRSTGTTPVGEGNAQLAAQAGGSLIQGLTNQEQQELAGTGQAISAQGQLQSGLGTAINATKPELSSVGTQAYYNPLTGLPSQGTGANTPFTGGVAQGQQAAGQNYVAMHSADVAAQGIQNTITSYLSANPDINPANLAASNALQQWIQGKQLTDPRYQTLFDYLSEYTNTLAPILGVGGDPTNLKTEIAQGFINAQASGGSIADVLANIGQLATHKVENLKAGATGSPSPVSGGSGSFVEGQTQSAGGYNFTYHNGQWVAQ